MRKLHGQKWKLVWTLQNDLTSQLKNFKNLINYSSPLLYLWYSTDKSKDLRCFLLSASMSSSKTSGLSISKNSILLFHNFTTRLSNKCPTHLSHKCPILISPLCLTSHFKCICRKSPHNAPHGVVLPTRHNFILEVITAITERKILNQWASLYPCWCETLEMRQHTRTRSILNSS